MHAAELMVPPIDDTGDIDIVQVVGNKNDTHAGTSISAHAVSLEAHHHAASNVYPTLAGGVAVATAAGAWTFSAGFTEIVPVTTITTAFDIHHICIEALDDNTVYEVVLFAATTEIGRVRVVKNANLDGTMNIPFQCAIQPANTQIQAKTASAAGNSVVTMSIYYHLYA